MKQPTKSQLKSVIRDLSEAINYSEHEWNNGTSHAFIIGYLQGAIKSTIIDLKTQNNDNE